MNNPQVTSLKLRKSLSGKKKINEFLQIFLNEGNNQIKWI